MTEVSYLTYPSGAFFLKDPSNLSAIPVYVDNTSHCHVSNMRLYELLCRHLPLSQTVKHKTYVSDNTFESIVACAGIRRDVLRYRSRFCKSSVRAMFGVWSGRMWWCKYNMVYGFSNQADIQLYTSTKTKHRLALNKCKTLLKHDKRKYYSQISENL